jgi:hypothetical protein
VLIGVLAFFLFIIILSAIVKKAKKKKVIFYVNKKKYLVSKCKHKKDIIFPSEVKISGKKFVCWCTDKKLKKEFLQTKLLKNKKLKLYAKFEKASLGLVFENRLDGSWIEGYNGTDKNVIIPQYYQGYKVVAVGNSGFYFNDSIETIYLPSGLEHIGNWAFEGCSVSTIYIPQTVQTIAEGAFLHVDKPITIVFEGTIAQWCAYGDLQYSVLYTKFVKKIQCSNGNIVVE